MCNISSEAVLPVFTKCVEAIYQGFLIKRESAKDKEYHFQNWFIERLKETKLNFDQGGRNSYPDFTMVKYAEGFELKGLAYPGRDASFDSNSQVPKGYYNGRTIYYVFGRYPQDPDGDTYPVLDLVVCHGVFLNADREYVHKNKSVKGFGSYGDILIRDRKMYVVPTPFKIAKGLAHQHTLILPNSLIPNSNFIKVGEIKRVEVNEVVVGYSFDLKTNEIQITKVPNPEAGKEHIFCAWRLKGSNPEQVLLRQLNESNSDFVYGSEEDND
jgi:hypothetical protein